MDWIILLTVLFPVAIPPVRPTRNIFHSNFSTAGGKNSVVKMRNLFFLVRDHDNTILKCDKMLKAG